MHPTDGCGRVGYGPKGGHAEQSPLYLPSGACKRAAVPASSASVRSRATAVPPRLSRQRNTAAPPHALGS